MALEPPKTIPSDLKAREQREPYSGLRKGKLDGRTVAEPTSDTSTQWIAVSFAVAFLAISAFGTVGVAYLLGASLPSGLESVYNVIIHNFTEGSLWAMSIGGGVAGGFLVLLGLYNLKKEGTSSQQNETARPASRQPKLEIPRSSPVMEAHFEISAITASTAKPSIAAEKLGPEFDLGNERYQRLRPGTYFLEQFGGTYRLVMRESKTGILKAGWFPFEEEETVKGHLTALKYDSFSDMVRYSVKFWTEEVSSFEKSNFSSDLLQPGTYVINRTTKKSDGTPFGNPIIFICLHSNELRKVSLPEEELQQMHKHLKLEDYICVKEQTIALNM